MEFYQFIKSAAIPPKNIYINKNDEMINVSSSSNNKITKYQSLNRSLTIYNDEFGTKNPYFCLKCVFDNSNHLNKYNDDIGNYYWHKTKIINKGSFSTAFLDEDKHIGFKIIISQTNKKYEDDINLEKYILQKIHNFGNFPLLYDSLYDDENFYLIEGMKGFDIKTLLKNSIKN